MDSSSNDSLRITAKKRLENRQGFLPHLFSYLLVNGGLVLVWATVANRGFFWPGLVMFFWGVGVVTHFWTAFISEPITEGDVDREVERLRHRGV